MVALFICLLSACALPAKRDAYGRPVPRWPSWTLKTDNPDPEGLICYDCFYVSDVKSVGVDHGNYAIIRYWESGHFIINSVKDYKDLEELNSRYRGRIGYFRIEDFRIVHEFFQVGSGGGFYVHSVGFVEEDGSVLIMPKKSYPLNPERYIPVKVGKVDWEPDW